MNQQHSRGPSEPSSHSSNFSDRSEVVHEVIAKRRSTRRFTDQQLDQKTLDRLIEAGINAPSGSNWQNQRFLVINDPDEITRIGRARWVWPYRSSARDTYPGGILGNATAIILVFAEAAANDFRGRGEYHIWEPLEIQNCSASIQNICLQATADGIANCWISASAIMNNTRLLTGGRWHRLLANYDLSISSKIQGIVMLGYPLATDDRGFPIGEKKHGATVWDSVARKPREHYLIKKRNDVLAITPNWRVRLLVGALSKLAIAIRLTWFFVDRLIEKVERRALRVNYSRDNNQEKAR